MINRVTLLGNLTRDAETVNGSQTTMTRMRLATHTNWRDANGERQRRAEFHNLVAFGDLAERCSMYCTKGRRVYVDGHLRTRDWTGADGLRRYSTEIVADQVRYIDSAATADTGDEGGEEVDGDLGEVSALAVVGVPTTAARTTRAHPAKASRGAAPSGGIDVSGTDVEGTAEMKSAV